MAIAPFALASSNGHHRHIGLVAFGNPGIDLLFHLLHFFGGKGTGTVEVKPQRSKATREPAWEMLVSTSFFNAAWSRWVAVWLAWAAATAGPVNLGRDLIAHL
jgi:hypothetical protein